LSLALQLKKPILMLTDKNYIENVEGLTFGKDLENGHKSLILVTDNNFSSTQKIQFILFDFNDSILKN